MKTKPMIPPSVAEQAAKAIEYANDNQIILSLLYDMGLLPEQVEAGTREWGQMVNVIAHFKAAVELAQGTPCRYVIQADSPEQLRNRCEMAIAGHGIIMKAITPVAAKP